MTTQIKSATDNIGTFDKDNPDIRFSRKRDVATSKEKSYNKSSYYREFDSLTMRWRNKADTEIGDRKVISRGEGIFSLLKATEDGYIELATGNWTKVKELKAEHERAYEEATDEIYGNYESYGADEGRDIWNMFLSEDGTDGFRNTGEIGTRGVQTNSSGSDEHSRGSHREKSVNTLSKF